MEKTRKLQKRNWKRQKRKITVDNQIKTKHKKNI